MHWNGWWHWFAPWHMLWMGLLWLLFLAGLVWLIYRLVTQGTRPAGTRDPAEDALRLRYARGEIDQEEYQRRLSDLRR